MMELPIALSFVIFIFIKTILCADEDLLINTNNGLLRGKAVTAPNGKSVNAFLGIPFAQPPVGELRYQAPLPAKQWEGVFNAFSNLVGCIQQPNSGSESIPLLQPFSSQGNYSEDCLTLDVWTPNPKPKNAAVLVYIFGGSFFAGATNVPAIQPMNWVSEHEVVHVAMNYRLGSFGFLYFDHPDTPGNLGLLDQVLALKWVKDNIQAFGGDPSKVTIYGASAGSVSVGFHLLSPVSEKLFHNAILQSGSPTGPWAVQPKKKNMELGMHLAMGVGCAYDTTDVPIIISCLRNASVDDLLWIEANILMEEGLFAFLPIVDGVFITSNPELSVRSLTSIKKNIILGTVKNEGSTFMTSFKPFVFEITSNTISPNEDDLLTVIKGITGYKTPLITKSVSVQYTNWSEPNNSANIVQSAEEIVGDYLFNCPTLEFVKAYSGSKNHVYQYFFNYKSKNLSLPEWIGVYHGYELYYTFGNPTNHHLLRDEVKFSKRIRSYWANFANTGNPNLSANGTKMTISWPEFNVENKNYLVLAPRSTSVGSYFHVQKCAFWREVYPLLTEAVICNQTKESV